VGRNVIQRLFITMVLASCSLVVVGRAAAQGISDNEGGLSVTPRRGPVGTTVTLRGNGCEVISFMGGDRGGVTGGFDPLPDIDLDADGDFEVTYKIPAHLEPSMGLGGGRPKPGTYSFRSFPPRCYATFVVTGLATTGPDRAPLAAIAVLGGLFVAVGVVLRVVPWTTL
jgi:hypothetical protein